MSDRIGVSLLFKEDDDEAMYKNPYEIRLCYLISVSLILYPIKKAVAREPGIGVFIGKQCSACSGR